MGYVSKIGYGANNQKALQLVIAGLTATAAMLFMAYVLRALGVPAPDYAAQLGALFNDQAYPPSFSAKWWAGLAWHLIHGVVLFPFLYDYLAHKTVLPPERWTKGIWFATGLWLLG